jgi:hypothetical protein
MARHLSHRFDHSRISNPARDQLILYHPMPGLLEIHD